MRPIVLLSRLKFNPATLFVALPLFLPCNSSAAQSSTSVATPLWIAPDDTAVTTLGPCPILRKQFVVQDVPGTARARVIGLGHFEFSVNGKRAGESLINQPWTQYNRTIYWQEFDITPIVRQGENVLGVQLGNSFWAVGAANDTGRFVKTDAMPDFSSGHPYILWLEVRIKMKNGAELLIASDGSWRWMRGPLTFSHIYAGEDYDARRIPQGWDAPGYDPRGWQSVAIVPAPEAAIARYVAPAIMAFEVFKPEKIVSPRAGSFSMNVTVPEGVAAEAVLPNGERRLLPPGESVVTTD